ncbi:MAG: integrase core domain-containing protein, partial [Pseudomonadota bacterium]
LFVGLRQARRLSAAWRDDHNHHRPQTSLDGLTPRQYFNRSEKDQTRNKLTFSTTTIQGAGQAPHRAWLAGSDQEAPQATHVAPTVPERPMQRLSLDVVSDQLADCRRFRVLNIVDDHSRFCPGQIVDVSIPGARVGRFLDDLAQRVGLPEEIILDNGPEGTSTAMFDWSERTGVRLRFIEPGRPVQNGFVESVNGKFRDDCLNLHWFRSFRHAREEIG